jgi:hypothetical protein
MAFGSQASTAVAEAFARSALLESASIAFLLTLIITALFSGIQQAGIGRPPWEEVGGFMMLLWAGTYAVSDWRYR